MTKISVLPSGSPAVANQVIPIYDPNEGLPANQNKSLTLQNISDFIGAVPLFTGKTIYVDSVYGNDGSGAYENPALPFLTIASAQGLVSSGDRIVIRPGIYNDTFLGIDGVNYHFEDGAILNSSGVIFYDFSGNSFSVSGKGVFISTTFVIFTSGTGNKISIEGKNMIASTNAIRGQAGDTEIVINIENNIETNGLDTTIRLDEYQKMYINCNKLIGTGAVIGAIGYDTSIIIVKAKRIEYNPTGAGYVGFNIQNGTIKLYGDIYINGNGIYGLYAFWMDFWNTDIHTFEHYGDIYSNSTEQLIRSDSNNGIAYFYGKINTISPIICTTGTIHFLNDVISDTNLRAITHNGGKTIIYSLVKNKNLAFGSSCLEVGGAGLILKQAVSLWVNSLGAESIYSALAQNVITYPGAVANQTPNINITQLVSTLLVDANVDSE
jgi:hypothetical protein